MAETYNVSVQKIQDGISYLENEFTNPLIKVGARLIDEYKDLNRVLKSEVIDKLIQEQQNKLDELQKDLKGICDRAKESMDDSSKVIGENQASIDDEIANI